MSVQLDETAICINCGYCLQGLAEHRCPECGRAFDPDDSRTLDRGRTLQRRWLVIAVAPTVVAAGAMAGFRALLAVKGLRLGDLWHGVRPLRGPIVPGTVQLAELGRDLASSCLILAVLTVSYCCGLFVVGWARGERRAAGVAAVCTLVCVVTGIHAVRLGFIIAGI